MNVVPRLFLLPLLLCAFLLAACGNKADLFMPPPPEPAQAEDAWDGEDPVDDGSTGEEEDEPAWDPVDEPVEDEPELPVPVPTGDE